MDYPAPLDVLKVTIFTTADEADRGSFSALAVIAFVFKPLRRFEILKTGKPPPVRRIARNGVASEPSRKDGYLYRRRWTLRIASIDRWRSELRWPVAHDAGIVLQS